VQDGAGAVIRLEGTLEDITERKRAEEAVRDGEAKFQLLAENIRDVFWISTPTVDRIVYVSPAYEEIWGRTCASLYQEPRSFVDAIHPDDRDRVIANFQNLAQAHWEIEYRILRTDGSLRWILDRGFPVRNERGEVTLSCGVAKDITERKRAERNIIESQERFAGVVNTAMDAIITVDADQRIVLFNHAAEIMFGYCAAELLGQPLDRILPERFRRAHSQHIKAFGETGVTSRAMNALGAVSGVRADGEEFPIEASIAQNGAGSGRLFTVILRDITERRRAEESIRQAHQRMRALSRRILEIQEAERRALARELHDEIGQVLSAVSVNLKIVKTKVDRTLWPRLAESAQIVDAAIEQVRNLSLDLRPAVLDDFGLESALRWHVERLAARTALEFHFDAESSVAELSAAVRTACFRVAQEALTNVVRHASARRVWVELRQLDAELCLAIRDDGKGFDFEEACRRASRGNSLGLLGMMERIELLGGRIEIESSAGKGTSVRVQLPLTAMEHQSEKGAGAAS
jgi:PAS domain S-box-containing protein